MFSERNSGVQEGLWQLKKKSSSKGVANAEID